MLDKKLLIELHQYVDMHLNSNLLDICKVDMYIEKNICADIQIDELEEFIGNSRRPTFRQVLFNFIDNSGLTDSYIYKKAGIDRRHFSKIRSTPNYKVGKNTAIALCLALELNEKETNQLLSAAGYSLTDHETFDLVIKFCIEKKIYNLYTVNHALDYFSLSPLAGVLK